MSYASAVTYIDELPPMVQLAGGNNPAGRTVRDDNYYKRNPFAPNENQIMYPPSSPPDSPLPNRFANYSQQQSQKSYPPAPANDYYEEIVKSYPSIQSKIRAPSTGGKYDDQFENEPIGVFANGQPPSGMKFNANQPANAQANYLGSNLTAAEMDKSLAIAQNIPLQYNRPFAQSNGNILYPIIEHNTALNDESSSGKGGSSAAAVGMSEFEKEQLAWHKKLYYLFVIILIALILIFIFLCIILYKTCTPSSSSPNLGPIRYIPTTTYYQSMPPVKKD